jgi:hypothetical protein
MSGIVTGAVLQQGPAKLRPRMVLVAIAEAADDHGFACLSMETIAMKALCEPRHAMRLVDALEVEGWLWVKRKAVDGKGSVYFVNIAKLGVVLNPKSRKNEWHLAFERKFPGPKKSGDKKSPAPDVKPADTAPDDTPSDNLSRDILSPEDDAETGESGDIFRGTQVTFQPDSGDISGLLIRKNRVNRGNRVSRGAAQPPDTRHVPFKLACETYAKFKGVAFVWDGSEAKALALLLRSSPGLTLYDFQLCLNNRAKSPGTPHGERPRLWLANITRYQEGPLNQFNRKEDGHGRDIGNRKASAANDALTRAQASVDAEEIADEQAGGDVPGSWGGDGRGSLAELLEGA